MSWIRVASVIVVGAGGFIVGKLWGGSIERKSHEPIRKENENLRQELKKLIKFFEERGYNNEIIIASIFYKNPRSKIELIELLKNHGLTKKETNRIAALLKNANYYSSGAA